VGHQLAAPLLLLLLLLHARHAHPTTTAAARLLLLHLHPSSSAPTPSCTALHGAHGTALLAALLLLHVLHATATHHAATAGGRHPHSWAHHTGWHPGLASTGRPASSHAGHAAAAALHSVTAAAAGAG
jgi:hypothetical protein